MAEDQFACGSDLKDQSRPAAAVRAAAWAKVEDVAATILFLASPENRVTRGAVVPVYGRT